ATCCRPRQTLLPILRSRQQPRAAPSLEGLDRQVQGPVRSGVGPGPRGNARATKEAWRRTSGYGTHSTTEGNSCLGFVERRSEESLCANDGGLCCSHCPIGPRNWSCPGLAKRIWAARQYTGHLSRRRQWRERRRNDARHDERNIGAVRARINRISC